MFIICIHLNTGGAIQATKQIRRETKEGIGHASELHRRSN